MKTNRYYENSEITEINQVLRFANGNKWIKKK